MSCERLEKKSSLHVSVDTGKDTCTPLGDTGIKHEGRDGGGVFGNEGANHCVFGSDTLARGPCLHLIVEVPKGAVDYRFTGSLDVMVAQHENRFPVGFGGGEVTLFDTSGTEGPLCRAVLTVVEELDESVKGVIYGIERPLLPGRQIGEGRWGEVEHGAA